MAKTTISVVTTLYNGNEYLPKLLAMFRANVKCLGELAQAEYVLVNDSPWAPVEIKPAECDGLSVRVVENSENYGIHKSRVEGIRAAAGEYILILDQDDEIADDYLLSQLQCIGDGKVVVCNGIKETGSDKKKIYRDGLKMSLVNRKHFYLLAANQIVSPGQCLIRKDAIPAPWLDNPQTVNGADDLFLWLLMLNDGIRFIRNPRLLYTHKQVGSNLSNSLERMCLSDLEMCQMLRSNRLLPEKDIAKRERMCAYLKASGYRNLGSLGAMLRYPDVVLTKLFAYYI